MLKSVNKCFSSDRVRFRGGFFAPGSHPGQLSAGWTRSELCIAAYSDSILCGVRDSSRCSARVSLVASATRGDEGDFIFLVHVLYYPELLRFLSFENPVTRR